MNEGTKLRGRPVVGGIAEGPALVSEQALSFFGDIDPNTGIVVSQRSDIRGECVAGRVLVFPHGRGSTVGSYVIFALEENDVAPCAIVNEETEVIIAAGCSLANIPLVDQIEGFTTSLVKNGDVVEVCGDEGWIRIKRR